MTKYSGFLLSLLGAALLLVASLGHFTDMGKYESAPPRKWERLKPNLVGTIDSYSKLIEFTERQLSEKSSKREIMNVLYTAVIERFTHKEASHTFFSKFIVHFNFLLIEIV